MKLARVTSSGAYVPQIDGLRLLAIVSVIAFHTYMYVPYVVPAYAQSGLAHSFNTLIAAMFAKGWFGVQLFFVISGFILSLPFGSAYLKGTRMPSVRNYFIRRLTRLEPPYILNLLVGLGIIAILHGKSLVHFLPSLGASLVYSHGLIFKQSSLINGVLWSLEIEAQFYILAPLLCRLFAIQAAGVRRFVVVSLSILVVSVSALHALPFAEGSIAWTVTHALARIKILSYIGYFLAGLVLADLYLSNWGSRLMGRRVWDVATLAAFIALFFLVKLRSEGAYGVVLNAVICPSIILIAYLGVFRGGFWNCIFGWRWIATLGGMCYTVYMYHQYLILMLSKHASKITTSLPILFLGFFVVIYLASALFFVAIEKPCMYKDWPSRLGKFVRAKMKRLSAKERDEALYPHSEPDLGIQKEAVCDDSKKSAN